jgi:hypothetical protein
MRRFSSNRFSLSFLLIAVLPVVLLATLVQGSPSENYDTPAWRKEIVDGYVPYRKLRLSDFRVDDRDHPRAGMYTHGFFHFDYEYRWTEDNGRVTAKVTKWVLRSGLDLNKTTRRSWFRQVERYLPHEQLHLDINELHARSFGAKKLSELPVGRGSTSDTAVLDLENKIKDLSDVVQKQAQNEQDKYDRETRGGTDWEKQAGWEKAIAERLKKAKISY